MELKAKIWHDIVLHIYVQIFKSIVKLLSYNVKSVFPEVVRFHLKQFVEYWKVKCLLSSNALSTKSISYEVCNIFKSKELFFGSLFALCTITVEFVLDHFMTCSNICFLSFLSLFCADIPFHFFFHQLRKYVGDTEDYINIQVNSEKSLWMIDMLFSSWTRDNLTPCYAFSSQLDGNRNRLLQVHLPFRFEYICLFCIALIDSVYIYRNAVNFDACS